MICMPDMSTSSPIDDGERAGQEIPVLGPFAIGLDRCRFVVVDPRADHPFELLQLFVVRWRRRRHLGFRDAVEQPLAVALHVDRRVLGFLRIGFIE